MGGEDLWPVAGRLGEAHHQVPQLLQTPVDGLVLDPPISSIVVRSVDEDRQLIVVVEEVGAGLGGGDAVLAAVRFAVAMMLNVSQPGLLQ